MMQDAKISTVHRQRLAELERRAFELAQRPEDPLGRLA